MAENEEPKTTRMMKDKRQELLQSVFLPIEKLENNTGQLEGIPANPRKITDADVKQLRKSIEETPEMLNARELLVVPNGDTWVAIGGNKRLRALRALGYEQAVCKIIPENYDRLAIAIKDNTEAGEWDNEMLAADWDKEKLADWGVVLQDEQEKQPKDLSATISTEYKLEITLSSEEEQEKYYNELTERGLQCRILTL